MRFAARRRRMAWNTRQGIATTRPNTVVTIACETPCASTTGRAFAARSFAIPPNAWNMPRTVPSRPTSGAIAARSASPKKPVLVVLGNEEEGISETIKKNCDELVIIPWAGMNKGVEQSCVDSLNVAQAASIIFYEMM